MNVMRQTLSHVMRNCVYYFQNTYQQQPRFVRQYLGGGTMLSSCRHSRGGQKPQPLPTPQHLQEIIGPPMTPETIRPPGFTEQQSGKHFVFKYRGLCLRHFLRRQQRTSTVWATWTSEQHILKTEPWSGFRIVTVVQPCQNLIRSKNSRFLVL